MGVSERHLQCGVPEQLLDGLQGYATLREPAREEQQVTGTPVEPGLVGHWKLDGGDDEIATDSSGLGNDAEVYAQWVRGDFGTCLLVDASPGALTVADGPHLHFGAADLVFVLGWSAVFVLFRVVNIPLVLGRVTELAS